jgi:hypothetical protein
MTQGSGKSHTTSVMIESCLIKDPRLGTLHAPLSGLVYVYYIAFHSYRELAHSAYLAFILILLQEVAQCNPARQLTLRL